jgi:hypothetical protein
MTIQERENVRLIFVNAFENLQKRLHDLANASIPDRATFVQYSDRMIITEQMWAEDYIARLPLEGDKK